MGRNTILHHVARLIAHNNILVSPDDIPLHLQRAPTPTPNPSPQGGGVRSSASPANEFN
ncbi:protein of unknown function, Doubtful CDS [Bradyrhizobium sp. ORS 285]|nr:protein of unknown function, Doubtful CDS [Bradyrhizobium sp. ORS 285]